MSIQEYLDALRDRFAGMEAEEREAVLVEIRDYLEQESEQLRNLSPGMEKAPAVEQAIEGFGAPKDIVFVYDGHDEVLAVANQRTGERLLDLPMLSGRNPQRKLSSTARAVRAIIKYRGVSVLVAIGLALVFLAAGVFFSGQDVDVQGTVDDPFYQYDQQWSDQDGAVTANVTETFRVAEDAPEFQLRYDLRSDGGCVRITLVDPTGEVQHDSGAVCGDHVTQQVALSGSGEWNIQYDYADFTGSVDVDAFHLA